VAIGGRALFASTIGSDNVGLGNQAGLNITTGDENICIGFGSGLGLATGSNNIRIGDHNGEKEDDTIRIGSAQTKTIVAGIFGAVVLGGTAVVVNSEGELGTNPSSRRFNAKSNQWTRRAKRSWRLSRLLFITGPTTQTHLNLV